MLTKTVNKMRNPRFRFGKDSPTHWEWQASGRGARWQRTPGKPGITIACGPGASTAEFHQSIRCKPDQFYRIEATVQCSLEAKGTPDEAGFSLAVCSEDAEDDDTRRSPALHQAPHPVNVRTYYKTGDSTRRLRISVGIYNAAGEATIESVRLIPILEPDEISHPMAMPPPWRTYPPPRITRKVCICSATAESRRITELLGLFLGKANVATKDPADLSHNESADAILLPDESAPRAIRTLAKLKALAQSHVVLISTAAFAKLAGAALRLKRIEQVDDPIHAEVTYANHATAGFALHDTFAYAWQGKEPATFRQNQFRKNDDFARFCKRHGFIQFLASMCDRDSTSHQPIALYHATERGGLYVLDMEPVETEPSTQNEPALAMLLLLNILGHNGTHLGQFISPLRKEAHFRDAIREFAIRIEHIKVHDADAPSSDVTDQLVTVGGEDQGYGLPLRPKPLILIRSGLKSGDYESVYGAWTWLKQFVRPAPHACPYAPLLASRFRIAWVPCAACWEPGDGWQRRGLSPQSSMAIETEDCEIAAMIDIVSQPVNGVRVVAATEDRLHEHRARWLPRLFASFAPADVFTHGPGTGCDFHDRRTFRWATATPAMDYVLDPECFVEQAHRDVLGAGGSLLRIETPGYSADFVAQSIARTDTVATLLEHVIGMQHGVIAVNRRTTPLSFNGFPPVAPGEALIVSADSPALQLENARAM